MAQIKRASPVFQYLSGFVPRAVTVRWPERLRSCVGALLGIAFTGMSMYFLLNTNTRIPLLIAPMGASAVLLFGVPASPLAQPWSIVGGNLVSAVVGVACASWIGNLVAASALAVGLAIFAMFALRCVHPPSGAVALTAVLGGPAIHAMGYGFVLEPVAVQSFALLAAALIYHASTGHRYPHALEKSATQETQASAGVPAHFAHDELEALLRQRAEWLAVDTDDLESLLRDIQLRRHVHAFSELTCANVMSHPPIAIPATTKVEVARHLLRTHRVKALPVIDQAQRVVGIVALADLMHAGLRAKLDTLARRFHSFAWRSQLVVPAVGTVMSTDFHVTDAGTPIADLVSAFVNGGHHHIPVLDAERRLVGMITPKDLIHGLYRQAQAFQQHAA